MPRIGKQLGLVGDLDDPSEIHHRDAMTDVSDHREIMGDEQIREMELALQVD